MNFVFNLKILRQEKGLTQKDLAEKIGVKQSVISDYERNIIYPTIERLIKIATVLNVKLDELIIY